MQQNPSLDLLRFALSQITFLYWVTAVEECPFSTVWLTMTIEQVSILTVQCFLLKIDTIPLSTAQYPFLTHHTEVLAGFFFFLVWRWRKDWREIWACRCLWWLHNCGATSSFILYLLFWCFFKPHFFFLLPSNRLCLSYVLSHSVTSFSPLLSLSVSFLFFLPLSDKASSAAGFWAG